MTIQLLIGILLICNLVSFFLFYLDKRKAKKKKWRVSESTLILSGFLMGAVGGILGMAICHHKTNKMKFILLMPLALIFNGGVIFAIFYFTGMIG